MKELFEVSEKMIELAPMDFIRDSIQMLDQKERLIGIKGSRGVGKTTLFLQFIKKNNLKSSTTVYISLDDLYFTLNTLIDFAGEFARNGGKFLFIDEVHTYKNWSRELKLIYDRYPELKVYFTGSSILQLGQKQGDLSRRAIINDLPGLSFREYLSMKDGIIFNVIGLHELLVNHIEHAKNVWKTIKPIQKYNEYLKIGHYPFFSQGEENYLQKLLQVIYQVIESDLIYVTEINVNAVDKLKQLVYIIATSVPVKPNIDKLSKQMGITRNTLKTYIHYLIEARILVGIWSHKKGDSLLTKPEKLYLNHPNIYHAIRHIEPDVGSLRESYFANQVGITETLHYPEVGDFLVNQKYTFEIGGKNKTWTKVKDIQNSFLALDNIETGYKNEIPLWLFGFLY